ncbi:DUF1272 domain-containing protein [Rhodococcus yunnanensis]|nr:DUF1272 domain-containing protein [Rhodococcus yunnanensis]MCZ4277972.1 DUF1272 domain-containing protein [Rhodococcus yunnanensis]
MKKCCEMCGLVLHHESDAAICSYECTFCVGCATRMDNRCPNCAGELCPRPRRSTGAVQIARRAPARLRRHLFKRPGTRGVAEET